MRGTCQVEEWKKGPISAPRGSEAVEESTKAVEESSSGPLEQSSTCPVEKTPPEAVAEIRRMNQIRQKRLKNRAGRPGRLPGTFPALSYR
jgi:hypothetical protein